MKFDYPSVQRLGFDNYVSNLVVNLVEDKQFIDGYSFENKTYSISVNKVGDKMCVSCRAYVDGLGWQSTELSY
jgi:hypothetical protein